MARTRFKIKLSNHRRHKTCAGEKLEKQRELKFGKDQATRLDFWSKSEDPGDGKLYPSRGQRRPVSSNGRIENKV